MPSLVELKYNPFIPNLSILIDGKQPTEFSRLVQYSDEDIILWYDKILDTIYSEVRCDFAVYFVGNQLDAEILKYVCRQNKYCVGFKYKEFPVADSLQSRMKKLNQYIKHKGNVMYAKTIIDAVFVIPHQMQKYLEDISELDVNNLFCSVRVSTIGTHSDYVETNNSFLFLITDPNKTGYEYIKQLKTLKAKYVLIVGEKEGLICIENDCWIYGTTTDTLFNTIFTCLLQSPLMLAFRKCVSSIMEKNCDDDFKKIYAVEPIIRINVDDKIEVGKSAKINISLDPPIGNIPKLIYKITNQSIAVCDGLCVSAKQAGTTNLEVYRNGDKKPFFTKPIQTYKRNRITKIFLSDDSILIGVGDNKKLTADYFPQNADNINTITWKSSDKAIIKVDKNGFIEAIGVGNCRIICMAENVSAQCKCQVKPYLKDITFDFDLENGVMNLEPMTEINLKIKTFPNNCIDDDLSIISSDYNVVNVVKTTLYAKTKGEATITVKNKTGSVSQCFKVVITKKKNSFFKNLFNKK
ncbi:MAG: Ig-like domain-containing protein [Clostridia bacterium]|nr:Ig-like domain-containing protein [Clostridia bacterium]